ncbi:hypothetical protein [Streptomyces chiangmaiensis]|uniref:Uncharacterized protein n=1 Tax=Streptomyces chiangmaiensis TaxID=766497 RepID=A0ABU7FJ15_9ACTN|nr:hypothetical protein [Streptomyces chiangmaiensis]MED7823808.1 hypothetical protein [Streptomyces chiangmaiensis]
MPIQIDPETSGGARDGEVDPTSSEVTRLLCQAVYVRPDRVGAVKAWWRKFRGKGKKPNKPRRSTRRRIYLEGSDDSPPLGEPVAQWVVDHVLHGPPLPVPSYGFDLVPVMAHSLRARRRRWARRLTVLFLAALAMFVAPRASVVWAVAVLVALLMRWAAYRALREGRKSRLARSPRVAYLVLGIPWVLAVVPYKPVADEVVTLRVGLVLLPFVLLVGAALVCVGDRLAARAALARLVREGVSPDRLPWVAVKGGHRITRIGDEQGRQELPYDEPEYFVGAGRDVWGSADIAIPLKPKDPEESVKSFGEEELLRRMGGALQELGRGAREITDPLPGFSVTKVKGLPSALWLQRTRAAKLELPDLRGRGRRSPSSVPDRLYLRAQCVSWGGQVVVTVFVHAALEAGELRLTVRPHVMTPLYNELRVTDAPVAKRGTRLLGWVVTQSLLDAAAGPLALWRLVARLGLGEQAEDGRAEEKDPVSLRDRYSTEEVMDMHQSDDAKRHVVLMQTCIFRTVAEYLDELGVDTAPYERQVAAVITNIQVYGDNNAPIQNVAGSGISNVGQDNKAQGGGS